MPGTRDRWDLGFHRCIYSTADQLSYWLTVPKVSLMSSVHSERGQMLWGSWETEPAPLTAEPWLVKRGQLRTRTQQRLRLSERHMSLFVYKGKIKAEKEKGKEETSHNNFMYAIAVFFYDLPVPRSIFCVRSNPRCTETNGYLKCHCQQCYFYMAACFD